MAKIHALLLLLGFGFASRLQSQNVTAAEYFFDNDPGVGKGKSLNIGTAGDSIHVADSLVTASLQPGAHTLSIRTKTSDGKWSLFDTRNFYLSQSAKGLLSVTAAEYFFDNDPGEGNGKPLTVGNSADSIHVVDSSVTASLQPGAHTFSIRTKTSDGKWSLFDTRSFYLSKSVKGLLNITAAEYFFDNDPGQGNGKPLTFSNSADSIHVFDSSVTASLQPGAHTLSIRTKTSDSKWSLFDTRSFYLSQSAKGLLSVTAAEYFFDNDPGEGIGKPLTVSNSADSIHVVDSSVTTSLQPGTHTVSIRTKTSDGKWSLLDTRSFYLSQSTKGLLNITAAEYFLDSDPGVGKGKSLKIGTPADSIHVDDSTMSTYLFGKDHFFSIRVKNSNGKWSLYDSRAFSFLTVDRDRDGLVDWEEPQYGTNPTNFDTNGDGLADGVNVFTGLKATSQDTDGDGISNAKETLNGTSPLLRDTDGDGEPDNTDDFPLDRFRKKKPAKDSSDHVAPVITLLEPF